VRRAAVAVAASAVVAAVVGGAFAFGLLGGSDTRAPEEHGGTQAKSSFQPWDIDLSARGAKAGGQPQCTYTPHTLYCARPGVLAAAVDPADGHVLWSRSDTGRGSTYSTVGPVLSGGLVQVVSGDGKRLTALDPATGTTRWSHDIARYDGRVTHVGGVVLLTGPDSEVTALDAATGEKKWRHSIPGQPLPNFFSYGDGVAYAVGAAGSGTRVSAVDPETGATRWQRRLDGTLSLVGAHDGVVWFTSTTADSYTDAVVRYDVADRRVSRIALRFPLPGAQAVVHGDRAYLLADGGSLVAVDTRPGDTRTADRTTGDGKTGDAKTGDAKASGQLWRVETSVSKASAPVVAGQRLYLTAADGRLLAVDTARGRLLGQTKARLGNDRGSLVSAIPAPVATGGRVYSAAPDGSLFAVDGRDPAAW
jgi:outer membrane protein assembly factor BamB